MSSESLLQHAIDSYEQGNTDFALEKMQEAIIAEPQNPIVRVEFANMLMREKRFDDARDVLNSLADDEKNNPAALALYGQLDSIKIVIDAPAFEDLLQTTEQDPKNCLAYEQLCAHYKLRGDYLAAMEQLLKIVTIDRNYNDEVGRKELLKIFDLLGHDHELTVQYRRKLAQALN